MKSELLIVNGDDFGCTQRATDAILACHRERALTSTTAMTYMEDSDRAARLALVHNLPVGLHINLTTPFTDPAVPPAVRERQARMIAILGHSRTHKWIYDVRTQRELDRSLWDQLRRFEQLYGRPPTHFDSHHHLHSCPNIFLSRAIPRGALVRNTLIWSPRRSRLIRQARRMRQRLLERRLRSPAAIICLDILLRQRGPRSAAVAEAVLAVLAHGPAEVMAHPEDPAEFALLTSGAWSRMMAAARTGAFTDLAADDPRG